MEKYAINYYSNIDDGIMSSAKIWYPYLSNSEKSQIFRQRRLKLGDRIGFSGLNMIMNTQKNAGNPDKYEDGKAVLITKDMFGTHQDLYEGVDPVCDIMMISHETPGVSLVYSVADCPVITVEDPTQGIVALSHCGCEYIDRNLPIQTVEALQKEASSRIRNLRVFVGPYAHAADYIYAGYPNWAKHSMQKYVIPTARKGFENQELYMIDIKGALAEQFKQVGLRPEQIYYSQDNTIKDNYYSNSISSPYYYNKENIDPNKKGRFITGVFYPNESTRTSIVVPNGSHIRR